MKLAFDTSILVASVLEGHEHHLRTRPWTRAVTSGKVEAQITWHAAAEIWSVLTKIPGSQRLAPAAASLVVDRILESFRPIEVSGAVYRAAIRRCSERGLRSGVLFDAIHLLSAEAEGVEGFVTFNKVHFERLRNSHSPKIHVPPEPSAFTL